jgi:hypothetical protein
VTERKYNGDLLECLRDLEEAVSPENRSAVRKVSAHMLRMEQEQRKLAQAMEEMQNAHVDPRTGKPFDVQASSAKLDAVDGLAKSLDERWKSVVWMGRGMLMLMGGTAMLAGFIFWQIHGEVRKSSEINAEQTLLIRDIQIVQRGVIQQLNDIRQDQKELRSRSNN